MPSWLSSLLQTLGLGTPAVYALAGVQGFGWIDRSASDDAKTALCGWMKSNSDDHSAIGDATIEMFDRVYTARLLSWKAFGRSALISVCLAVIFLFETYAGKDTEELYNLIHPDSFRTFAQELVSFSEGILANVFTDYVSLFAVRHLLVAARSRPFFALWAGPLAGIFIVAILNFFVGDSLEALSLYWSGTLPVQESFSGVLIGMFKLTFLQPEWRALTIAAFVVHLWLPLFGIVAGLVCAFGWMQYFFKDGRSRPYELIGYLLAGTVLLGGFAFKALRMT